MFVDHLELKDFVSTRPPSSISARVCRCSWGPTATARPTRWRPSNTCRRCRATGCRPMRLIRAGTSQHRQGAGGGGSRRPCWSSRSTPDAPTMRASAPGAGAADARFHRALRIGGVRLSPDLAVMVKRDPPDHAPSSMPGDHPVAAAGRREIWTTTGCCGNVRLCRRRGGDARRVDGGDVGHPRRVERAAGPVRRCCWRRGWQPCPT